MKIVIFNFNMSQCTDEIYNKLIKDGFSSNDIIVADNGSTEAKSRHTNFMVPRNVRFIGQSFVILNYLLSFFDDEEYLFITTSGKLLENINYKYSVDSLLDKNNKFGFISSSLVGGNTQDVAPAQLYTDTDNGSRLQSVFSYQPIVMLLSRDLLLECRSKGAAYFNLSLNRGWGLDRELQYIANKMGLPCYVDFQMPVEWMSNSTHKSGKADESLESYRSNAQKEMTKALQERYGKSWQFRFYLLYLFRKYGLRKIRTNMLKREALRYE